MGGGGSGGSSWDSSIYSDKSKAGTGGVSSSASGGSDPCDITFETVLNSPNVPELQNVTVNEVLEVGLVTENSQQKVIVTKSGTQLGVIVHPLVMDLITCINSRHEYVAKVIALQGIRCQVIISRK